MLVAGPGENLASGYNSWQDVVYAWYNEVGDSASLQSTAGERGQAIYALPWVKQAKLSSTRTMTRPS